MGTAQLPFAYWGAFFSIGEQDLAILNFSNCIRLKPDYAPAHNFRAIVYYRKGDYKSALADFEKTILLKPDFAEAYFNRGIFYLNIGEKEKAVADFRKFLELNKGPYLQKLAEKYLHELGVKQLVPKRFR